MALPIRWAPNAARHLEDIIDFIEKDSLQYSVIFAKRVVSIVNSIPSFPYSGRVVPEYNLPYLREKIFQGYRIVYCITPNGIEIVAISHGARLLHHVIDPDAK